MSYPDPPPPPHPFISPPYYDGNAGGFRPQLPINRDYLNSYSFEQQQHFFERPRNFENTPPDSALPAPLNSRENLSIPPFNRGSSHIFYKTRMCLKFMEGNCKNGDTCTFAHGPEDLRKPPPNWQELVKDRGTGNLNNHQDIRQKMKICNKFYKGEVCPYGEKCHFLHKRQSSVSSGIMGAMEHWNVNDCYELNKQLNSRSDAFQVNINANTDVSGDVSNANSDELQASMKTMYRKTKLCSKWVVGLCPFGDRCHFAHGESDLKVSNGHAESNEVMMNAAGAVEANPSTAVTISDVPPTIPVIATNSTEGGQVKKGFAKWGPNKKINKIYGDWIDDLSPPRS